jgi:SAM-dependent methyltransferase
LKNVPAEPNRLSTSAASAATLEGFDGQARSFDLRAGLSEATRAKILAALSEVAGLVPEDSVLEIGSGTGELGIEIAGLFGGRINYVGLDISEGMLRVFRERAAAAGILLRLERTDASERWPVSDASVNLIFGSRSLHWIRPEHLTGEALRTASRARAVLLVGRVRHDPAGPRARMRRRLHELLRSSGHEPRSGADHTTRLIRYCEREGGRPIARRTAATFSVEKSPREILEDWRGKSGLGGLELAEDAKRPLLSELESWTAREFGNMDARLVSEEEYTLEGVALSPRPSPR